MADFSKATLAHQDEDRRRAIELKQGLETIDLKASMSRPGATGGESPTYDEQVMDSAALTKWKEMVKRSKEYAIKQHQIKYQIHEGSPALQAYDSFAGTGGSTFGKL